jgi:hypothetical protein
MPRLIVQRDGLHLDPADDDRSDAGPLNVRPESR